MSTKKKAVPPPKAKSLDLNHILNSLILIAYGYVTILTPNLKTLDSNGPKFMTFAMLNILVFLLLFLRKDRKMAQWAFGGFFRNPVALAYSLLMVISLLSFSVATNVKESVLHFSKVFTVFSAAWMISVIVYHDKSSLRYLAMAMTALLVYDCITVFNDIFRYMQGNVSNIVLIKSVYSNKNILASAIFVKIPFAFWLLLYEGKWGRITGLLVIMMAVAATLFMTARAFYLGTIGFTIASILYFFIRYKQKEDKRQLQIMAQFAGAVVLGFLIFTLVPKIAVKKSAKFQIDGVGARLATIGVPNSEGGRLKAWKRSFNLIRENPLLGVGLGNWKVDVMKQENLTSPDFIYFYKNHNDFIETTAETGIFGGLCYLAIFAFILYNFIRELKKKQDDQRMKFTVLPALGIFCYTFDASFNFPQDRPEMQALFALFVGFAIALTFPEGWRENKPVPEVKPKATWLVGFFSAGLGLLIVASCYFLVWNFTSLKLQRLIKDEMNKGALKLPASKFLNEFPPIPDINVVGEPVAVQKARYLINEKRNQEAIDLLKKDHASPWDMRKEFFIAMAYNNMQQYDSALVYNKKVLAQKPRLLDNNIMIASILERRGKFDEAGKLWEEFLSHTRNNAKAWNYAAVVIDRAGNTPRAYQMIDSARHYAPTDTMIQKNYRIIFQKFKIEPYKDLYQQALSAFNVKNYAAAVPLFNGFLEKVPDYGMGYELRAFCWFFLKDYAKSIEDINSIVKYDGTLKPNVLNLRGVNLKSLNRNEEACKDFEAAMKMGDKDATTNYRRFCQAQTQTRGANDPLKVFK